MSYPEDVSIEQRPLLPSLSDGVRDKTTPATPAGANQWSFRDGPSESDSVPPAALASPAVPQLAPPPRQVVDLAAARWPHRHRLIPLASHVSIFFFSPVIPRVSNSLSNDEEKNPNRPKNGPTQKKIQ